MKFRYNNELYKLYDLQLKGDVNGQNPAGKEESAEDIEEEENEYEQFMTLTKNNNAKEAVFNWEEGGF